MMKLQLVGLSVAVWLAGGIERALAQYASSGSGYASPAASNYAASPASQSVYPSVNLPLLGLPSYQGAASVVSGAASVVSGTAAATGTNYLSTLPAAALALGSNPSIYAFGVYADDYDASRDSYYNKSSLYPLNQYTTALQGFGALNLSSPSAVAAANWWAPYPYQLAAWNDGYTTQAPASTTQASLTTSALSYNSSVYYAAYGGNVAGLGVAGLGLSVPGYAPNVSVITPQLNLAYNTGSPAPASGSSGSSYGSSGSSYGRR